VHLFVTLNYLYKKFWRSWGAGIAQSVQVPVYTVGDLFQHLTGHCFSVLFATASKPALGPTQTLIQWVLGFFSGCETAEK
jgi:hypothetical protein